MDELNSLNLFGFSAWPPLWGEDSWESCVPDEVVPYTTGPLFMSKGEQVGLLARANFWHQTLLSSSLGCVTSGDFPNLSDPQFLCLVSDGMVS